MKRVFAKIFFSLSPFFIYTISGNSMLPKYQTGDRIFAHRIWFDLHRHDVIILTHPQTNRLLLKRIEAKYGNSYFVLGDNKNESTDSRSFGWVTKKNIVGKVLGKVL